MINALLFDNKIPQIFMRKAIWVTSWSCFSSKNNYHFSNYILIVVIDKRLAKANVGPRGHSDIVDISL